ncbi:MAG: DUF1559 domain-containing protein [Gemmatales bacterium]
MIRHPSRSREAFTLVELLVVVAILLLLLALLLPAVHRVREAANKVVCASHLRQIGQGVQLYLASNNQLFPSGGGDNPLPRTLNALGLPTSRMDQDWGWLYQILPYLEQEACWKFRSSNAAVASYVSTYGYDPSGDTEVVATPIETYFCPSRRNPQVIMTEVGKRAMNDYAGNIGAFTLYDANGIYHPSCANASGWEEGKPKNPYRNGVFVKSRYFKSQLSNSTDSAIHVRDISDGLANTILAADKRMNSASIICLSLATPMVSLRDTSRIRYDLVTSPTRDFSVESPTPSDTIERFGSAHPYGINALFCDGSVRTISYNIPDNKKVCQVYNGYLSQRGINPLPAPNPPYSLELTLFQRLCHRSDGAVTELRLLDD